MGIPFRFRRLEKRSNAKSALIVIDGAMLKGRIISAVDVLAAAFPTRLFLNIDKHNSSGSGVNCVSVIEIHKQAPIAIYLCVWM
jgi:hypothetical protein